MKLKKYYAWIMLGVCCLFFGASVGIYNNCVGLYTAPMLEELGWSMTFFSLIGLAETASRVVGCRLAPALYRKYPLKMLLSVSVLLLMGACIAKSVMRNAVQYILICLVVGMAGAILFYLPVPLLINNWFVRKKDTAMGLAVTSSGLFAAVASPLFSNLIVKNGWRAATFINGLIGLAIALPPVSFAVKTPEEMGLKPYGWEESSSGAQNNPSAVKESPSAADAPLPWEEKRLRFLLTMLLAALTYGLSYIPSRIPHFAASCGIGTMTAGLMFSCSQIGNMAGKIVIGPLSDRFGPRKAYTGSLILVLFCCLGFAFLPKQAVFLYPAAVLSGLTAANSTMIYPAAARTFASGDDYADVISRASIVLTLSGTVWSLLLGQMYDRSGGYTGIFLLLTVCEVAAILSGLRVFREKTRTRGSK